MIKKSRVKCTTSAKYFFFSFHGKPTVLLKSAFSFSLFYTRLSSPSLTLNFSHSLSLAVAISRTHTLILSLFFCLSLSSSLVRKRASFEFQPASKFAAVSVKNASKRSVLWVIRWREKRKKNTKGAIERADVKDKTNNMKYKSGFKIEFRVLPLSFYPPLLEYTPRVTSRRHQSIANVVQYVFFRKRRGNKIITEWTYMLVWQFNTKHTTSVVSAVQWWLARLSTQCSLDCTYPFYGHLTP